MRTRSFFFSLLAMLFPAIAAADPPTSWNATKNAADDFVYSSRTFYCGCLYKSDGDTDGSGEVYDHDECDYEPQDKHRKRAFRVEWEHVVPASLMPARQLPCWVNHGREYCERNDLVAQAMIFDLHNLVPSIGQVNALRSNDRFGEIEGEERAFGACAIEDVRGLFEPADEQRGDVARIWLYMNQRHAVEIPAAEMEMFERWNEADPVSDWERERNARIKAVQGNGNPFVE